jgi:Asp-tRNA(Asn)/Glu-tRNA(Gln) amidotransferase B subunit
MGSAASTLTCQGIGIAGNTMSNNSAREVFGAMWEAKSVDEFRAGKEKAFNALIGQAMKASRGKANPAQLTELLKRKLAG